MLKLQNARIKAGMKSSDVVAALQKVERRIDKSLYSKMEHEVVYPTPEQFAEMCRIFGKCPSDIFNPVDVDYGVVATARKRRLRHGVVNISARIPVELIRDNESLNEMIRICGYGGRTDWMRQCIKRLQAEYAARSKPSKKRTGG